MEAALIILGNPLVRKLLAGTVIVGGLYAYHVHAVHSATSAAASEAAHQAEVATLQESNRRLLQVEQAKQLAEDQAKSLAAEVSSLNDRITEIDRDTKPLNVVACLDPGSVRTLSAIRSQADHGTHEPRGPTPVPAR